MDAVPLTDDQRFLFDLKGWVAIPAVLTESEIEPIREHLFALASAPETVPPRQRNSYAGPCQILLDHPVVVGALREIIAPDSGADAYGFRCDNSFWTIRRAPWDPGQGPHNGGPYMGPTHTYDFRHGRILSPATRVVWELNPVRRGDGGTLFLSGSHKSNYPVPPDHMTVGDPLFEDYECPAGSLVLFTENVCHSAAPWKNPDIPRVAVFNHYMHFGMRFHRSVPPHDAVMEMPPKRRSLFRDVWMADFPPGKIIPNNWYDDSNRAHPA